MLGIMLAWRAAGAATRPLQPSQWQPADNDVDVAGGIWLFALLLLVLLIGTVVLTTWGIVAVTSRMVTRTTIKGGGE